MPGQLQHRTHIDCYFFPLWSVCRIGGASRKGIFPNPLPPLPPLNNWSGHLALTAVHGLILDVLLYMPQSRGGDLELSALSGSAIELSYGHLKCHFQKPNSPSCSFVELERSLGLFCQYSMSPVFEAIPSLSSLAQDIFHLAVTWVKRTGWCH